MEPRYLRKHAILKLARGCCPSFHLCYQKNLCYRRLMKIHQHGAKILDKTCSFEVSKGLLHSSQLSHQKNPFYKGLMKICQHGAKIFNKMCSFEVSIGLLPLILIVSSKEFLLQKSHENPSRIQDI